LQGMLTSVNFAPFHLPYKIFQLYDVNVMKWAAFCHTYPKNQPLFF